MNRPTRPQPVKRSNTPPLGAVFLVVTFLCVLPGCADSSSARYDYSTPEQSFRSLQKAFREKDADGVAIHFRKPMQIFADKTPPGSPDDTDQSFDRNLQDSDWLECDSDIVELSPLKLSDVTEVKAGTIEQDEEDGQILLFCPLTLTWPNGATADDMAAISSDNGKTWWCGTVFFTGVHPTDP